MEHRFRINARRGLPAALGGETGQDRLCRLDGFSVREWQREAVACDLSDGLFICRSRPRVAIQQWLGNDGNGVASVERGAGESVSRNSQTVEVSEPNTCCSHAWPLQLNGRSSRFGQAAWCVFSDCLRRSAELHSAACHAEAQRRQVAPICNRQGAEIFRRVRTAGAPQNPILRYGTNLRYAKPVRSPPSFPSPSPRG